MSALVSVLWFVSGALSMLIALELLFQRANRKHKLKMEQISFFGRLFHEAMTRMVAAAARGDFVEADRHREEANLYHRRVMKL